jgi:hypothetical protein
VEAFVDDIIWLWTLDGKDAGNGELKPGVAAIRAFERAAHGFSFSEVIVTC